jgi:hypothetical protein
MMPMGAGPAYVAGSGCVYATVQNGIGPVNRSLFTLPTGTTPLILGHPGAAQAIQEIGVSC